jgi:hypothetical protein
VISSQSFGVKADQSSGAKWGRFSGVKWDQFYGVQTDPFYGVKGDGRLAFKREVWEQIGQTLIVRLSRHWDQRRVIR